MSDLIPPTIEPMVKHVLKCLEQHISRSTRTRSRPLFVAFQGPQGSGKTFLTNQLKSVLSASPHNYNVAVLSIDDLYLPHSGLKEVAERYPDNALLSGRGQPGTHDIPLGTSILAALKEINEAEGQEVQFPVFEKSLFNGEGDRVEGGPTVRAPLDIVILEGWCVGFCPVPTQTIDERYETPIPDLEGLLDLKSFKKDHIQQINDNLWAYVEWWSHFDCFIQVSPPKQHPLSFIYGWRLQQEHNMKAKNGGKGMTDEQVKRFVDRYIPGYVFFSDGIKEGYIDRQGHRVLPPWRSNGLKVTIDENRNLLSTEEF